MRSRAQLPVPKQVGGSWKIWYRQDEETDGRITRKQRTRVLGRASEMTFRQAQKAALAFIADINNLEPYTLHTGRTVADLVARWRADVAPLKKESTRCSYEWALKKHILPAFGGTAITDVSKAEIQAFITAASRKLAPESVWDIYARLRGLFTLAVNWDWVKTNPAAGGITLPRHRITRPKRLLAPQQLFELASALRQPYSTIVLLAGLSGLRRGELAALRWDDIGPGTVRVDEAVYDGVLADPKTHKSNRVARIGTRAEEALAAWRAVAPFTGPRDFVFGMRTNSPIDLNRVLTRNLKPAARKLRLPPVSWHDLRHNFVTWGRAAGIKAEAMRDQLGHASVETTQDIYSHIGHDDVGLVVDSFVTRQVLPDKAGALGEVA